MNIFEMLNILLAEISYSNEFINTAQVLILNYVNVKNCIIIFFIAV
jgi:hypothetical protein